MAGAEDETLRIAAVLEEHGRGLNLKIRCTCCGVKMNMTDLLPFEIIQCPGCHSDICRPAFFGDYLIKQNLPPQDPLTSIYLAADLKLERDILIRILNPSLAENGELAALYLQIAQVLAACNHPSVIPIYNCGETMGLYYIVTRKTDGGTLDELLERYKDTPFPVSRTLSWMRQIISALKKALESNLCHGNLSPRYLLMDGEETILISGFGLGALGAFAGIPLSSPCSAPESERTIQSDIYSAGMVFFRLITGHFPKAGERKIPQNIKLDDPEIAALIRDMLDPDPALRITPDKALAVFDRIENKFKTREKRKSTVAVQEPAAPVRKRGFTLLILAAALVLLLGAAIGFFFFFRNR